jgi:2,4-dienoyl-CoA reductase-like NADH-dependent reductase (Old Yellow Enzyme family)
MSSQPSHGKSLLQEFNGVKWQIINRIALAPMTRISATEDGCSTETMKRYYTKFARGGFGLLITEGVYTDELYSQGYLNQPGIANAKQTYSWIQIVDSVHKEGAKIVCQLMHAGAVSQGNRYRNHTIAPSARLPRGEQMRFYRGEGAFPMPKEMDDNDISAVKIGFATAARNAKKAGFDGVEIHGANGYLLDQFLTDYTNTRADRYGGSTESRVRFIKEIIQAVREAVGESFVIGVRISQQKGNDGKHKWTSKEADAKIIFSQIGQSGVDYIHVTEPDAIKPAFGEGETLAALSKKYGKVPVIANGGMHDPLLAEAMVTQGVADLVSIGKGALANQDWPIKWRNNEDFAEFQVEHHLLPLAYIKDHEI